MITIIENTAEAFLQATNVSRETLQLYQNWYNLLTRWNNKINLVSPHTIHNYWLRHALDSQQLCSLAPEATKNWIDLGAGAGFPGLAIAIAFKEQETSKEGSQSDQNEKPSRQVTLIESNGKKCNFLRAVIRELNLPATAKQERVENAGSQKYDVISARAFAPLPKLFEYSLPFFGVDTLAIFPKGRAWQEEVEAAQKHWQFTLETKDSKTDPEAKILLVTDLKKRDKV